MKAYTKETQSAVTPSKALEILKEGNERFLGNKQVDRDLLEQVAETGNGQFPIAVVLGCIDSRVPAETVFDLGIGDIFNARVAGNFVNEDILGSMEFACKVAGSKLVVVLGHSKCGAVKGACDDVKLGNLTALLSKIKPAVDAVSKPSENRNSSNAEFVEAVANKNVELTIENIRAQSPVLKEMEDAGEIAIVGGKYDVDSGRVEFFN